LTKFQVLGKYKGFDEKQIPSGIRTESGWVIGEDCTYKCSAKGYTKGSRLPKEVMHPDSMYVLNFEIFLSVQKVKDSS
jgi:hypothetical protein